VRVTQRLPTQDEAAVAALAARVRGALALASSSATAGAAAGNGNPTVKVTVRATRRPADYELEFRGVGVVPGRALAAAGEGAYINFERQALVGRVARRTPDIVS